MNRLAYLQQLVETYGPFLDELTPETTFEEMNMDSYAVVDFILKVEEHFNIVMHNDDILALKSMQDVLDMIDRCSKEEEVTC
ncbi:MAG: hypothetical protein EOM64_07380 [Erysipelotrichia bacterium]|nr:hypothetical protein [Erysipelotrichia bacterium]